MAIGLLALLSLILFGSGWLVLLGQNAQIGQVSPSFMSAFALLFAAGLLIPSAYNAAKRLSSKKWEIKWLTGIWAFIRKRALLLLTIFMMIGAFVSQFEILALFALPPIHAITSALIVLFLLMWVASKISLGSPQRYWGVLAASIILGPLIAIVFEVIAGAIILFLAILYISTQPQYAGLLESLTGFSGVGVNQEILLEQLSPLFADPLIILLLLLFISLAVPIIEELIKPIGLYLSLNRNWSPASGFALGALSGAGFALFENLALAVGPADWLPVMGARIGTTAIHLLTSGLIGWSLVKVRSEKKYGKLFGTYLLSVFLHGFWNAMALLLSISALPDRLPLLSSPGIINGMLLGLLVLTIGSIFLLRFNNRKALAAS